MEYSRSVVEVTHASPDLPVNQAQTLWVFSTQDFEQEQVEVVFLAGLKNIHLVFGEEVLIFFGVLQLLGNYKWLTKVHVEWNLQILKVVFFTTRLIG